MDEIDEILIQYKSNNKALEKFIEKFKEKRILIQLNFEDLDEFIDSSIQVDFIKAVIDKYEANIAIKTERAETKVMEFTTPENCTKIRVGFVTSNKQEAINGYIIEKL